jgi:hypothetical protein
MLTFRHGRIWRLASGLAILLFWQAALWRLGVASFWYDELLNADLILERSVSNLLMTLATEQPYPPFYYVLLKGWAVLVNARPYAPGIEPGSGLEFLLRFPSVMAGVVLLALLVPVGRKLSASNATLFPCFLALHPVFLWYARDARLYLIWICLTLAAVYALMTNRRWLWWFAASSALLTHYFALFPIAGATLIAFLTGRLRPAVTTDGYKYRLRQFLALAVPYIFLGVWMLLALRVTLSFQDIGASRPPDLRDVLRMIGPDLLTARLFMTPLSVALDPRWGYGLLVAALLGLGLGAWRAPAPGGIALGAVILGAIATFAAWQLRPVQHARYLVWILPVAAVGWGVLSGSLWGQRRVITRMVSVLAAVLALLWGAQTSRLFLTASRTVWYPDFRDAVQMLNRQALPDDFGIALAAHSVKTFTAYRTFVDFVPGPGIGERMQPDIATELLAGRPDGARQVWTLLYQDAAVDPGQILLGTLEAAEVVRSEMFYSRELRLFAYALSDAHILPLRPQYPLSTLFEGGIALRGWSFHREDRLLVVYLFWELESPQSKPLIGAVHLAPDAHSAPVTQRDKLVLSEYWMLPDLGANELLPDRYELVIPADFSPGTYSLFAMLYMPESGQRLLLTTHEDRQYLGEFVWP